MSVVRARPFACDAIVTGVIRRGCSWTPSSWADEDKQLAGVRVAGGEVHRGERAIVDTQRHPVAVEDVEHVEDVPGAAHQAEHLGDVHGVARPRIRQQFAELRPLERVEAPGGARLLEDDRVLDAGLVQDEVLPGGRLLVGRDPLVDQVRHRGTLPYGGSDPTCRQTLSAITIGPDWIRAVPAPRNVRVHRMHAHPVGKRSFADRRTQSAISASQPLLTVAVHLTEAGRSHVKSGMPDADRQKHTVHLNDYFKLWC